MNYKFILFSLIGLFIFLFVILNFTRSEGFQNQQLEYIPIQEKALQVFDMFKELMPVVEKGLEEAKPKIEGKNDMELNNMAFGAAMFLKLFTDNFNSMKVAMISRRRNLNYKEEFLDLIREMADQMNILNKYETKIVSQSTLNKAKEIIDKIIKTVETTNFDSGLTLYVKSNFNMDKEPEFYTKNSNDEYIPYIYVSKPVETSTAPAKSTTSETPSELTEKEIKDKIIELQGTLNKLSSEKSSTKTVIPLSETGFDAMNANQKMEILRDIQEIVRNEILNQRFSSPLNNQADNDKLPTDAIEQGREFKTAKKELDKPCPPIPDMTQYIRKDQIPCWGCSIDY